MLARLTLSNWLPRLPRRAPRSRVPEINLLPEQFRRRLALTLRQRLYLAILLELLIAFYVYQSKGEASIQGAQQVLSRFRAKEDIQELRIKNLQTEVQQNETQLQQLRGGGEEIRRRNTNWALFLEELFKAAASTGTQLQTVRQAGGTTVTVSGLAPDVDALKQFRNGIVESKQAIVATVTSFVRDPKTGSIIFSMSLKLR